jgi:hypothetical protein
MEIYLCEISNASQIASMRNPQFELATLTVDARSSDNVFYGTKMNQKAQAADAFVFHLLPLNLDAKGFPVQVCGKKSGNANEVVMV